MRVLGFIKCAFSSVRFCAQQVLRVTPAHIFGFRRSRFSMCVSFVFHQNRIWHRQLLRGSRARQLA